MNPPRISRSLNAVIRNALSLAALVLFLTACTEQKSAEPARLNLSLLEGADINIGSAPIFLLNYWATWCKPCLEEMPELNEFSRTQDTPLLGVNYDVLTSDLSLEEQREQAAKLQVEFGVLDAPSTLALEQQWQLPRPKGLPTTYLLASNGVLLGTLQGPQTLKSLKEALIQAKEVQVKASKM